MEIDDRLRLRLLFVGSADDAQTAIEELTRSSIDAEVELASDRASTERALDAGGWNAVVADEELPGWSGMEVLRLVRSRDDDLPFFLLSSAVNGAQDRAFDAMRAGATDFLMKDRLWRLGAVLMREMRDTATRHERKHLFAELRRNKERFRRTFEKAPIGIATIGASGRFMTVNEHFAAIVGYERRELVGRPMTSILDPDDAGHVENVQSTVDRECRFTHKDGHTVWVHITLTPTLDQVIVLASDVTGQRATAQRLALQAQLLDSVEQAVIATDSSLRIIYSNRYASRFFGWSDGQLLHDTIAPEARGQAEDALSRLARGETWSGETRIRRSDGETCPVWVTAGPIRGDDPQRPTGVVATFTDISERRKLEVKLEQANRLSSLGRVAATIAHEFNNVLMGIAPFVEVIRRTSARDRIDSALGQIAQSINRGKRITGEILRFTQPAEPVRAPFDAGEWLRAMTPEMRSLLPQSIALEVTSEERLIIDGDASQLHQALINLVLNARDAMPGGGKLTIRAEREEGGARVHLVVADTGIGMSERVRQHMFEPLFTTKKRGGTGLGLPLAHLVVSRHGGEILVDTAPGAGTTFHLFLRAAEREAPPEPAPSAAEAQVDHTRRVLLVEDDPIVATGILSMLELEGFSADTVGSGAAAIDRIRSSPPDLVVLDLALPDMAGTDVYDTIALTHPTLPVIFSTGHLDQSMVEKYLARPNVSYLIKPYDAAALLAAIQTFPLPAKRGEG